MVPAARAADESAADGARGDASEIADEAAAEDVDVIEVSDAATDDAATDDAATDDAATDDAATDDAATDDVSVEGDATAEHRVVEVGADDEVTAAGADEDEGEDEDEDEDAEEVTVAREANVVSLFRDREPPPDKPDVEGLFERLRSETADTDRAADVHGDQGARDDADRDDADRDDVDEDDDEPTPFSRRDEAIVPLIVSAARKLKRVLADEQNLVLDALRQNEPVTGIEMVLPELDEHVARYTGSIDDELLSAAAAGAGEHGVNDTKTLRRKLGRAGAVDAASALVRTDLIGPLRDRLERSVADGSGDNDDITKRVRAVYREWKTQHIDDQLDDVFRFAHGGGLAAIAEPGSPMVWSIDPSEPACPDCEDNTLAGPVAAGEPYPTGHTAAPAHAGCRCLTVPVGQ
jgi:hypothetical protein